MSIEEIIEERARELLPRTMPFEEFKEKVLRVVDKRCKLCQLIEKLEPASQLLLAIMLYDAARGAKSLRKTAYEISRVFGIDISYAAVRRHLEHTHVYEAFEREKYARIHPRERLTSAQLLEDLRRELYELRRENRRLREENEKLRREINNLNLKLVKMEAQLESWKALKEETSKMLDAVVEAAVKALWRHRASPFEIVDLIPDENIRRYVAAIVTTKLPHLLERDMSKELKEIKEKLKKV